MPFGWEGVEGETERNEIWSESDGECVPEVNRRRNIFQVQRRVSSKTKSVNLDQ